MKTSLDLPDDLYRRVKSKSALEGRAVRDVATALFAAWVDGRVSADAAIHPAAMPMAEEADPRREWLVRWNALAADVAKATRGPTGLVDQLSRDRR